IGLSPASCGSPIVAMRDRETTIQGWVQWHDQVGILRRCVSGLCGWFGSTGLRTRPSGRRYGSIASKLGCPADTLRKWVRQDERDTGQRGGLTTDERQRFKELERENRELTRTNA